MKFIKLMNNQWVINNISIINDYVDLGLKF